MFQIVIYLQLFCSHFSSCSSVTVEVAGKDACRSGQIVSSGYTFLLATGFCQFQQVSKVNKYPATR